MKKKKGKSNHKKKMIENKIDFLNKIRSLFYFLKNY